MSRRKRKAIDKDIAMLAGVIGGAFIVLLLCRPFASKEQPIEEAPEETTVSEDIPAYSTEYVWEQEKPIKVFMDIGTDGKIWYLVIHSVTIEVTDNSEKLVENISSGKYDKKFGNLLRIAFTSYTREQVEENYDSIREDLGNALSRWFDIGEVNIKEINISFVENQKSAD